MGYNNETPYRNGINTSCIVIVKSKSRGKKNLSAHNNIFRRRRYFARTCTIFIAYTYHLCIRTRTHNSRKTQTSYYYNIQCRRAAYNIRMGCERFGTTTTTNHNILLQCITRIVPCSGLFTTRFHFQPLVARSHVSYSNTSCRHNSVPPTRGFRTPIIAILPMPLQTRRACKWSSKDCGYYGFFLSYMPLVYS